MDNVDSEYTEVPFITFTAESVPSILEVNVTVPTDTAGVTKADSVMYSADKVAAGLNVKAVDVVIAVMLTEMVELLLEVNNALPKYTALTLLYNPVLNVLLNVAVPLFNVLVPSNVPLL